MDTLHKFSSESTLPGIISVKKTNKVLLVTLVIIGILILASVITFLYLNRNTSVTNNSASTTNIFGSIQSITLNSITFNKYEIVKQDSSSYESLCGVDGMNCPNGYYLDMTNPKVLSYTIDNTVNIKVIRNAELNCEFNNDMTASAISLSDFINSTCNYTGANTSSYFDLTVNNGKVTEISEHYLP